MAENLSAEQQEQVLAQVRSEVQTAALQEMFTKISEKCFTKCVSKPSTSLGSGEQKCLAMCMDRYIDTMSVVSQTMMKRGQQQ
mmetsp:Transcript_5201/g.7960  ORF Transcript_5201/g.7960 Transcript_5201/m.7960 type:complete len:83 (+) Transcript_5201:766-1014(+)